MTWFPAKALPRLIRVQAIPEIVAGSILNVNQSNIWPSESLHQPLYHRLVGGFISSRDIVYLTGDSPFNGYFDGITKIIYIDPISNLSSSPIQRNLLSLHCPNDCLRNQLLWMLPRSEIIGASENNYRELVRDVPGLRHQVRSGLGS